MVRFRRLHSTRFGLAFGFKAVHDLFAFHRMKRLTVFILLLPPVLLLLAIALQGFVIPLGIGWLAASGACLVWGIRIVRRRPRAGWWCIACGVICLALVFLPVLLLEHAIRPYVLEPMKAMPAPHGARVGHMVNTNARTLSVFSSNSVVVVADPGVSFQYEVLWLVEKPRKDKPAGLLEYKFSLPKYAMAEHINALGSKIPPGIQKVADGNQWRR